MNKKQPLYAEVMDKLKERIKNGDFEYGVPFTTEEKITQNYNVSRITAIRALDELEKEGIIYRKRGSGSFVSEKLSDANNSDSEDMDFNFKAMDTGIKLVALVLPFDVKNGGMTECFRGINDALNRFGCFVSIFDAKRNAEVEMDILCKLLEKGIDAVICNPVKDNGNVEVYNQFSVHDIPLVLVDKHIESFPISYVSSDNYNGAKELCRYAIKKGHKKIGFVCASEFAGTSTLRERYLGYSSALIENDMEVKLDHVKLELLSKYNNSDELKKQYKDYYAYIKYNISELYKSGVTAVMCQHDWMALDVIGACAQLGISVPDDMLVMGFDNTLELDEFENGNKIVTMEQNFYEIGKMAGELILRELKERSGMCVRRIVPVKLVDRTQQKGNKK